MPLNWSKLAPHRPLEPGDPHHVRRPDGGGDELARWITAGTETVAIAGPAGSGKSTELARVASCLRSGFVVIRISLDRLVDVRRVTEEEVLVHLVQRVVQIAREELRLVLSDALLKQVARGRVDRDLLRSVLREIAAKSRPGTVVLLLDGLDKCEVEIALCVARALLDLREEARVVLVVPYSVVVGRHAHELAAKVDRWFFTRAVPVGSDEEQGCGGGYAFFREIVRVRLDAGALEPMGDLMVLLARAAGDSGGVPRVFLQIVRATASYAAMAEREVLTDSDLVAATRDHAESTERLLVEGDLNELRAADGTSGIEVPEDRRLRLLRHGLLLERRTKRGIVVHPTPLLRRVLAPRSY